MKTQIYCLVIFLTFYFTSIFLFRYFIDTKIIESNSCAHLKPVKAKLISKNKLHFCYWEIDGKINEHFYNCDDVPIGQINDFLISDYSCDDLLSRI